MYTCPPVPNVILLPHYATRFPIESVWIRSLIYIIKTRYIQLFLAYRPVATHPHLFICLSIIGRGKYIGITIFVLNHVS